MHNYNLQETSDIRMLNGDVEKWAGPVVDGSEEAQQVDLFLDNEHKAFANVDPTATEVCVQIIVYYLMSTIIMTVFLCLCR